MIRPHTVNLQDKTLTETTDEIDQHYIFDDNQVKIADHIDDIRLIPASNIDEDFKFHLEFENSKHTSEINLQEVSVLYGK